MDEIEHQYKAGLIEYITAVMMLEADGLTPTQAEDQVLKWERDCQEQMHDPH